MFLVRKFTKLFHCIEFFLCGASNIPDQGAAFRGRKFRIFLEKAIIDVKYHSRPFLMEDFYIFIFFVIYRQGNISNIFFVIFRREKISFSF